jgi:hypothetical protein
MHYNVTFMLGVNFFVMISQTFRIVTIRHGGNRKKPSIYNLPMRVFLTGCWAASFLRDLKGSPIARLVQTNRSHDRGRSQSDRPVAHDL